MINPEDAAAVAQMTGTHTGLFDSSPSGALFAALIVFTGLWVANRIPVVANMQARLSTASKMWLAAFTATVAYAQWMRLRREIDAWMRLDPADRGVLVIPSDFITVTPTGAQAGSAGLR